MIDSHAIIPPGSTIGILGNGQLGRMTALAAAQLGYRSHVFGPEPNSPAEQVAHRATLAAYDDMAALDRFAEAVDVVTFEFENIPHDTVARLADKRPVRPSGRVLHIAQDRLREKRFLNDEVPDPLVRTTDFHEARTFEEFRDAVYAFNVDAIVKTTRFGYDGKGQVRITGATDLAEAWRDFGGQTAIVEAFVGFEREISVIVARGLDGEMTCYDPVENEHRNHILLHTHAPAPIDSALGTDARLIAETIAVALDLTGLLAVEMFVTHDGVVLVNELAPRPHNSGHWTIDACITSQFEQFVRAVCGLPLGSAERHHDAQMTNLLGDAIDNWPQILGDPHARLHIYGKSDARPGRKMGHVTRLRPLGWDRGG